MLILDIFFIFASAIVPRTLTKYFFMRQIQIQVFQSLECRRDGKCLFERIIDSNESLDIPWNKLYDSLKFMYPGSIIQFAML